MKKKRIPYVSFSEDLKEELKNPKFREAYERAGERLEVALAIAEMRHKAKLSQKALAKKLKISQAAVARMESGSQNFTLKTLFRIGEVFGKRLKIKYV
jgi:DNA-binding XRE family transcriptional regulator